MKYTLDSSFWVSFFYGNDINHERAKEIFLSEHLVEKDIIINNFIIEEVSTVLTYKGGKKLSNNFLDALEIFNLFYSNVSIKDYINFYQEFQNKISFADIAILYDAIYYNTKLISFDKQQKNLFKQLN